MLRRTLKAGDSPSLLLSGSMSAASSVSPPKIVSTTSDGTSEPSTPLTSAAPGSLVACT